VVWQPSYGDTAVTVWETGKVDMLDGYCVIVPEMPPFRSNDTSMFDDPMFDDPYDLPKESIICGAAAYAEHVTAILDKECLWKAHYIGYGMGGYIGWCLLAHCPERWVSMAIGGWSPVSVSSRFGAWTSSMLLSQHTRAWAWGMAESLPNLEKHLQECSNLSAGYPRVLLWASESYDQNAYDIRVCSQKYRLPLATAPYCYDYVEKFCAEIPEIRADLLRGLEPWYVPQKLNGKTAEEKEQIFDAWATAAEVPQACDSEHKVQTAGKNRRMAAARTGHPVLLNSLRYDADLQGCKPRIPLNSQEAEQETRQFISPLQ
jgi:pimeloyl-ACP methyl ester carboxylesterase